MVGLSASETEFLAEQELIVIMPHFHLRENSGMLNFISVRATLDLFNQESPHTFHCGSLSCSNSSTSVEFWRRRGFPLVEEITSRSFTSRVNMDLPNLFARVHVTAYLTSRLEREKSSEVFEELPFHYLEIASLLLKNAPEDLEQSEHIRSLLEDVQNVRQDKIRNGLAKIAGDVQAGETAFVIQLNNISALEITSIREFMLGSLNQFYRLSQLTAGTGEETFQSQSESQSQGYSDPSSADVPSVRRLRRHRG